jgi:hypothetical protein
MVSLCFAFTIEPLVEWLLTLALERVEGKDYSQGYKTYGFAAPFTTMQDNAVVTPIAAS